MHKLVNEYQGAFVKDRQILDGVLISSECIDNRLKQKNPGVLCKIDMEKAFDHVKWKSLLRILEKHGFGGRWISWIRWCISSANITMLVNGSNTEKFKPSKGLRQGDALSPFFSCWWWKCCPNCFKMQQGDVKYMVFRWWIMEQWYHTYNLQMIP